MSQIDIEDLERLYQQATSGPWTWEATGEKSNEWCLGTEFEGEVVDWIAQSGRCENLADPMLIVAMHKALPYLLAEIRTRRELYANLLKQHDAWARNYNEERETAAKLLQRVQELEEGKYGRQEEA
jgi:hypothetical protein